MLGPVFDCQGWRECQTIVGNNRGQPKSNAADGAQRRPNRIGYLVTRPYSSRGQSYHCRTASALNHITGSQGIQAMASKHHFDQAEHRRKMQRQTLTLHHNTALGIKNSCTVIASLFDVGGVRTLHQREVHFFGKTTECIAQQLNFRLRSALCGSRIGRQIKQQVAPSVDTSTITGEQQCRGVHLLDHRRPFDALSRAQSGARIHSCIVPSGAVKTHRSRALGGTSMVLTKSIRRSEINKPSAHKIPGLGGTITRRIDSSRATSTACSGPAPP